MPGYVASLQRKWYGVGLNDNNNTLRKHYAARARRQMTLQAERRIMFNTDRPVRRVLASAIG